MTMATPPDANRRSALTGLSADLKAAAGAVGWLAGSMSGVVALFYAVGFLCAKAHLNMLGIELFSGIAAGDYVETGAKFFYITLILLLESLFDLGGALLPVLLLCLAVLGTLVLAVAAIHAKASNVGLRSLLGQWWSAFREKSRKILSAQPARCILLALVLLWAGAQYRYVFAPVQITGVLHTACTEDHDQSGAALLACRIRQQEHGALRAYYAGLAGIVFALFLVTVSLRHCYEKGLAGGLFHFPLLVLLLIYGLVLPLTYGSLVMPNDFPRVNLTTKQNAEIQLPAGPFFLIHQSDKSLILWHGARRASYVIPASGVSTLEVIDHRSLFAEPPASPNTPAR